MTDLHFLGPENDSVETHIIMVHGLQGNYQVSWTNNAKELWPNWLVEDTVDVCLIDYEAPFSRWTGKAMLFAERANNILTTLIAEPRFSTGSIVLVGHSFGGLLIKKVIQQAIMLRAAEPKTAYFLDRLQSIIFLATPHFGSALATKADRLRILVCPTTATASLVANDEHLQELNTWFRIWAQRHPVTVLSLVETKPTRFLGIIVSRESSDPGLGHTVHVDEDHISISKPVARTTDVFRMIRDQVHTEFGFDSYIQAELSRLEAKQFSIQRTLNDSETGDSVSADELLSRFKNGAMITAPSGFGKSTLCEILELKAIHMNRLQKTPIPIIIPLTDVVSLNQSLLEFVQDRLAAHCPGVTVGVVNRVLRSIGFVLFCDELDRIPPSARQKIKAEVRNLLRDHKAAGIFVFGNPNTKISDVSLKTLSLVELSVSEVQEVGQAIQKDAHHWISAATAPVRRLFSCPLLLALFLRHCAARGALPEKLDALFQVWLEQLLRKSGAGPALIIELDKALEEIAWLSSKSPIDAAAALKAIENETKREEVFETLVACGALLLEAGKVEVVHQGLADYLRARRIVGTDANTLTRSMEAISIDSSTLFPPLLMSMVGKWDLQSQLWKRIARIDLSTYLSVLKYRSDLSDESRNQPEKASARFLEELIDGVELPLNAYFQPLRRAVLEEIVGERNVRELAVKGRLSVGAAAVGFSFLPRPPSKPSVLIDEPEGRILRFFNLSPSGYRLDSGRLIGMGLVKDGLKAAIEKRHLAGGERWISHLVQGQLRFLFQEAETIPNRDELEITLSHYRGKIVPQRGDKMFSIDALLENLRSCNPGEVFGPARAPMDEGRDALKALFDKHYADALLIYRELVEKNVPALASQFGFFSALPLRFEVIITSQYWHISRWRPVASWDRVGADVEFRDSAPDLRLDAESWFASAAAELQALKRPAKFSHMWTAGMMPDWDGHDHLGNFDGETSSLRQACEWFARDMDAQLRTVPSSDHV